MAEKKTRKKKKDSGITVVAYDKNWQPMTPEKWHQLNVKYAEVIADWINTGKIIV